MVTSLYVGRFQPFHKGHLHAVKYIANRSDRVIIGIGSALESHTLRNPFTAGERIEMILLAIKEASLPLTKFLIIPIPDAPYHRNWVPIVETLTPSFDVVYSNEPLTRLLFKEAGYEVREIPLLKREVYSGEEFRRRVINNENWREIVSEHIANFLVTRGLIDRVRALVSTDKPK